MSSSCGFTEIVLEGEAANDVYALLSRAKEVTHELMGIVWFLMHYAGYDCIQDLKIYNTTVPFKLINTE